MLKRILLATLVVFVTWQLLDFVMHTLILMKAYEETKDLWRPMEEFKFVSLYVSSIVTAALFVAIYGWLVNPKNMKNALVYGLLFGLGAGTAMGYGSYSWLPIPYFMAFTWFVGTTVKCVVAGALLGFIVKDVPPATA
jgi:hypothetical protein